MGSSVIPFFRPGTPEASGRDAELAALFRAHEESRRSGRARFVFVRGPAGVGKTHLFGLLRQSLAPRGVAVFETDSARDVHRPFGLFQQMVEALFEALAHAGAAPERLAQLSVQVAPLLGTGALHEVSPEGRQALYDGVGELFALMGRTTPVFLFPDLDVQDAASLELFRYLAAVVSAPESFAGGLYVASFRDEGPLPPALAEVVAKVSAQTVSLGGLDLDGIRAYLSRPETAEHLFEATGGMPAVLEALLHPPPGRPLELFLHRVQGLSESARAVLELLSVAPSALHADTVGEVLAALGRTEFELDLGTAKGGRAAVPAALDQLVKAHLLTVKLRGGTPVYRFVRDADRESYAAQLAPERRLRLMRVLGERLHAHAELQDAAALLLEADPHGRGVQAAVDAADALVARGAHEEAARLLERALAVAKGACCVSLHRRLCELDFVQGRFRAVVHHAARARVRRTGSPDAALIHLTARALLRLGRIRTADRLLGAVLGSGSPQARALAVLTRAEWLLGQGDAASVVRWVAEHAADLEAFPEQALALRNIEGKAHLLRGALDAAQAVFADNQARAEALGLGQLQAQASINQGVVAHRQGDFARAIACYQAGLPQGQGPAVAHALAGLGSVYAETGEFELALDHRTRALQAFSKLSVKREISQAASNLARLHLFLGDLERAVELGEHALVVARDLGDRYLEAGAQLSLGTLWLERGDLGAAQRLLAEARDNFERVGSLGYSALAAAQKARVHLVMGERAQAEAELSSRVVERGSLEFAAAQVEVELCRAELALLHGDLLGAGRAAGRAKDALLQKPDLEGPYRVYFLMGRLRAAAGDVAGAQAELARSARLLDALLQRVPVPRRMAFLSVRRRSEVLAGSETELKLPRPVGVRPNATPDPGSPGGAHGFIGRAPAILKIIRQLEPVARSNATVLIRGESGTGKELLAQALHDLSLRRGMPLVKVNCAAMVEDLLLSELFGHEKGAFTGAVRERKGRFELADGGTIFLDEIGDISPKAQVSLLRVLQEREFQRVGGSMTHKVDVRVVCATNRDLEALIAQGRFRQDLYYRLKGVMLHLPPLRERQEDLAVLAQHFLDKVAHERGESPKLLSRESLSLLARHPWPGNIRELENVLASATLFADGPLVTPEAFSHVPELVALMGEDPDPATPPSDAPLVDVSEDDEDDDGVSLALGPVGAALAEVDFYALARKGGLSLKELRQDVERQCIQRALQEAGGNISEAARLLRMKRSRLSQIVNGEPSLKGLCHGE